MTEPTSIPPIYLEFTYTHDDVLPKYSAHYWKHILALLFQFTFFGALILWAGGWTAIKRLLVGNAKYPDTIFDWAIAVISVLSWAFFVGIILFFTKKQKMAALQTWKEQHGDRAIIITLSSAAFAIKTTTTEAGMTWETFGRFTEFPKAFVLYPKSTGNIPLPKRIMTPDQIIQIRLLLQSHIGKTHAFPVLPA